MMVSQIKGIEIPHVADSLTHKRKVVQITVKFQKVSVTTRLVGLGLGILDLDSSLLTVDMIK